MFSEAMCHCHNLLSSVSILQITFKRSVHQWKSDIIRSSFISYFKNQDHLFIQSSPVVPWNDKSLEFVNSGMNQFKSILLNKRPAVASKVVNSQKCIRIGGKHNDLSVVGKDTYHHTFFEMLGSWSFNDYFKEHACRMCWDLLTNVFKIPSDHLYVTYFAGEPSLGIAPDTEVKEIWKSIGVREDRILPFGAVDNFWEMGDTGPCGACTEIHFEHSPSLDGSAKVNKGLEDLIEIWNIVFIQYERLADGSLILLPSRFVDTGMGLERITACLNGRRSNYDTDLFQPIFKGIQQMSGTQSYGGEFLSEGKCLDTSYRILTDHSRMVAFCLADGLLPHDRYPLRKAIRRCLSIGWEEFGLKSRKVFMGDLVGIVTEGLERFYPELAANYERSRSLLAYEEETYSDTLSQLAADWPKLIEDFPQIKSLSNVSLKIVEALKYLLPKTRNWQEKIFPLEEALTLLEKYALTQEAVSEIAHLLGFHLDAETLDTFCKRKNEVSSNSHRNLSKSVVSTLRQMKISATDNSLKYNYGYSSIGGYSYPAVQTLLKAIFIGNTLHQEIREREAAIFITESSNFYPNSGGQLSDIGVIRNGENIFKVSDVDLVDGYVLHYGEVQKGNFGVNNDVEMEIKKQLRLPASKSHTAHHLFVAALNHLTGMAFQRSSKVTDKGFTLTVFIHPTPNLNQLIDAELLVRNWIDQNEEVCRCTLPIFEAIDRLKPCLVSGELYPEEVNVISVNYKSQSSLFRSVELCCGTHLVNTGHIGHFTLIEMKEAGKGILRVSAVHGKEASKLIESGRKVEDEFHLWRKKIVTAVENNERLFEMNKEFKRWKSGLSKSKMPITVFESILLQSNQLLKQMELKLVQKSNWEELHREFSDYLKGNRDDVISYSMKTDYRGSMENLSNVIRLVQDRPAAFVCKGWGKVRACVFIPQKPVTNSSDNLTSLKSELQSLFPGATVNRASELILHFHLVGVKFNELDSVRSRILDVISKYISDNK